MSSITPASYTDIQDMKLVQANTTWHLNKDIFAECVELGCVPMITNNTLLTSGEDSYYFVHHEQVGLYQSNMYTDLAEERAATVMQWLHSHHQVLAGLQGKLRQ